jgi:DNA mismatch repair protein MutL
VQRPASIVKELLENSIDAGATKIELIVEEAGRNLVKVVDNGAGCLKQMPEWLSKDTPLLKLETPKIFFILLPKVSVVKLWLL